MLHVFHYTNALTWSRHIFHSSIHSQQQHSWCSSLPESRSFLKHDGDSMFELFTSSQSRPHTSPVSHASVHVYHCNSLCEFVYCTQAFDGMCDCWPYSQVCPDIIAPHPVQEYKLKHIQYKWHTPTVTLLLNRIKWTSAALFCGQYTLSSTFKHISILPSNLWFTIKKAVSSCCFIN